MQLRHIVSTFAVGLLATGTIVAAAPGDAPADAKKDPKKDAKKDAKKDPKKDAKKDAKKDPKKDAPKTDAAAATAPGAGSGSGSAAPNPDDAPPKDMVGTAEDPGAPKAIGMEGPSVTVVAPPPKLTKAAYPIEEVLRPITLPRNMSEISIDPHVEVSRPTVNGLTGPATSDALRARYGITNKVQLGLTYMLAGIYDDPNTPAAKDYAVHPGKAMGLDLTVLLDSWIGARLALPMYVSPFAMSVVLGAPMKFVLSDKVAIGGMDEVLTIRADKFAPSFYQELDNAIATSTTMTGTAQSRGNITISGFGEYQYQPNFVIIGRIGFIDDDFSANRDNFGHGGITTFIRAGFNWTPRKYLDAGLSLGFEDLSRGGSFAPAGFLAFRI